MSGKEVVCPSCGAVNLAGSDECENCHEPLTSIEALVPKKDLERRIIEGDLTQLGLKAAISVAPKDSLSAAVEIMRDKKIGCVLVVSGKKLLGLLSERELLRSSGEKTDWKKTAVERLMRQAAILLKEDDSVADAFHQMAVSGYRHLAVQRRDGSYGVISARDLLRYLCQ